MKISITRSMPGRAIAACALATLTGAVASAAYAAPAALKLRVEGASSTIYEGPVTSDGHVVSPATGQKSSCDGTNGDANPTPGPTPTSTLDDGARLGGFSWDGEYFDSFNDYLVNRIGPDRSTNSQFWGQFVNSKASSVGGCQEIVKSGDEVLWAFDAFAKQHVLRLAGPAAARTNTPVAVKVTDGADGEPLSGAAVGGVRTGAGGVALVRFGRPGIYRLKATKSDSVRSNALSLCVDPPEAEPCTSSDATAPRVRLSVPRLASDRSVSPAFPLSWTGTDGAGGSGIRSYRVQVRALRRGHVWRQLTGRTALTRASFRGRPGWAYRFRVSAVDRAGNWSVAAAGTTVVPIDDRNRKRLRLSRGWRKLERKHAWKRSVSRSIRGARARMRVRGRRVVLIGRELRRGGRLRITVAGRAKVIRLRRLRGTRRYRQALYVSAPLPRGAHTLRLRALDRAPVEIDAVAVLR